MVLDTLPQEEMASSSTNNAAESDAVLDEHDSNDTTTKPAAKLDKEDLENLAKQEAIKKMCDHFKFKEERFCEKFEIFVPDKRDIKEKFVDTYMKHKFHDAVDELDGGMLEDYYCFLHFDLQNCIGYSFNAQIRECVDRKTGQHYAVKMYEMDPENYHELSVLELVKGCPYTVNALEMYDYRPYHRPFSSDRDWNEYELFVVMELMPGGSLEEQLQRTLAIQSPKPIAEDAAREVFHQMLHSVEAIHARKIVHRDLTPGHFMFNKDFDRLVLGGFTVALNLRLEKFRRNKVLFTMGKYYAAPEIRNHPELANYKSDIWSLGAILYELLIGVCPDGDANLLKKLNASDISADAKQILKAMLSLNPEERPDTFAIRFLPWMFSAQVDADREMEEDFFLFAMRAQYYEKQAEKGVYYDPDMELMSTASPKLHYFHDLVKKRVLGFAEMGTTAGKYRDFAKHHSQVCKNKDIHHCVLAS